MIYRPISALIKQDRKMIRPAKRPGTNTINAGPLLETNPIETASSAKMRVRKIFFRLVPTKMSVFGTDATGFFELVSRSIVFIQFNN